MTVRIVTSRWVSATGTSGKAAPALLFLPIGELKSMQAGPGDMSYLDVSGMDGDERRKTLALLKRRCGETAWGVADPGGAIDDPAALFFAGASDYLGPALCDALLPAASPESGTKLKARAKAAAAYSGARDALTRAGGGTAGTEPAGAVRDGDGPGFSDWKTVRQGTVYPFYFLHVAVSAHTNLKTRLGEAAYAGFRDRLRAHLQQALSDADPVLWMETDTSKLYLLPPRPFNSRAAVVSCLRILLGAPLVCHEKLGLPFPIAFSFALHYGRTEFAAPGKTGTIVSDAVNFIFHLGTKKAEPGRLVVSGEASRDAIPDRLADLFVPGGAFEGHSLSRSRRFGVR